MSGYRGDPNLLDIPKAAALLGIPLPHHGGGP
jgi:hypothetical protein